MAAGLRGPACGRPAPTHGARFCATGLVAGFAVEGSSGAAALLVLGRDAVGVEGGHADGDDPPLGVAVVALLFGFLPKIT